MSNASSNFQRERRMRSLDIIRVHNIDSEDYIFWDDKYGPSRQRLMVPGNKKDIGKGKGNNDLPRYLAERFTKQMIEKTITEVADEKWEKKKQEYRTLDETIQHADKVGIRTNDQNLWEKYFPLIWLGVIEKYGGDSIPDPVDPMIPDSGNPMEDTMKKLSIADKPYEEPIS